jgi:hypothetical protein
MGRKRIGAMPLTGAEKQKRHREKRRAELETLKAAQVPAETSQAAMREAVKKELRETWEPELKAERIAEQRKEGRRLARQADQSHAQGRIEGICDAAAFFIGRDRADITRALLHHFMIDRETAAAALEADKPTKNMTLASLDKAGAWGKAPDIIK